MSATEWTTTPPTETGWYWAYDDLVSVDDLPDYEPCGPSLVFIRDGKLWDISSAGDPEYFPTKVADDIFTHWLGPLPVPKLPQ